MAQSTATLSHTPGDENRSSQTVVRISDPNRTRAQIQSLLTILAQCEHTLIRGGEIGSLVEVNKKAEDAAAETYALAQLQLRNIIDENPRWQLNVTDGDRYLEKLAEAQHAVINDQRENLDLLKRPHRRLNANIQFFPEMNAWIAWLGNSAPTRLCLHGVGPSPVEAFEDFDAAFLKRVEKPKAPEGKKPRGKKKK